MLNPLKLQTTECARTVVWARIILRAIVLSENNGQTSSELGLSSSILAWGPSTTLQVLDVPVTGHPALRAPRSGIKPLGITGPLNLKLNHPQRPIFSSYGAH